MQIIGAIRVETYFSKEGFSDRKSPLTEVNEELSLAEIRAQRVHACTLPLFVIKDGGQRKGEYLAWLGTGSSIGSMVAWYKAHWKVVPFFSSELQIKELSFYKNLQTKKRN